MPATLGFLNQTLWEITGEESGICVCEMNRDNTAAFWNINGDFSELQRENKEEALAFLSPSMRHILLLTVHYVILHDVTSVEVANIVILPFPPNVS